MSGRPDELREILGADGAISAINLFGLVGEGEFAGKVILNLDQVSAASMEKAHSIFEKLQPVRNTRIKPQRDEKILANWNGMMISSLALGAAILAKTKYRVAATKAGEFIWQNMRCADRGLLKSFFENEADVEGELDDHAQLARGYISLFDLTQDQKWLRRANSLKDEMLAKFADPETGDFYATSTAYGFTRTKLRSDVDQPSGNGAALDVLARLSTRTQDTNIKLATEKTLAALSGIALKGKSGGASILSSADRYLRSETGTIQYAGNGNVRVSALYSTDNGKIVLKVSVAEGWHVNASQPLEDHLIATQAKLNIGAKPVPSKIDYPEPAGEIPQVQ